MSAPTRGLATAPSSNTKYHVTYNSVYVGLLDEKVDLSNLKQVRDAITTNTTGKVVLGHRQHGVSGSIKIVLRQVDNYQCQAMAPWWSGTGAIPLCPPQGSDSYAYSHTLLLHPEGGDTTADIAFTNATPSSLPFIVRDGVKEDVFPVEFDVYPSRTAMASDLTAVTPGTIANA